MTHEAVATVEALRVDTIEVTHQPREVGMAGVQHQVVVVPHQAVGQHLRVEAFHGLFNDGQVRHALLLVTVDRLAAVTPRGDVVCGAGGPDADGAGHGGRVRLGGEEGKWQDLTPSAARRAFDISPSHSVNCLLLT